MKLVAIVGTNAELSYNRFLLQWMRTHFAGTADIDVLEIGQLPAFNEDLVTAEQDEVMAFAQRVEAADGVIIGCPRSAAETQGPSRRRCPPSVAVWSGWCPGPLAPSRCP